MKIILLLVLSSLTQAFASVDGVKDIYQKIKDDFESNRTFYNSSINELRETPLKQTQIAKLPETYFLDKKPFFLAMAGRDRLIKAGKIKNHSILAVTDFSRHSRHRRVFIMDVVKGKVLINTYTSHASNTDSNGDGYADSFSNVNGSEKSSLGFMGSDVSYYGIFGYSMRMRGLDPKLNSNVLARAVVVHGFGGMDVEQASWGQVATSLGCLMFSNNEPARYWGLEDKTMIEVVVDTLKRGSLIFNYVDTSEIFQSEWIKLADVPEEEKAETKAVEYQQESNKGVIVSHHPYGDILPAEVNP